MFLPFFREEGGFSFDSKILWVKSSQPFPYDTLPLFPQHCYVWSLLRIGDSLVTKGKKNPINNAHIYYLNHSLKREILSLLHL